MTLLELYLLAIPVGFVLIGIAAYAYARHLARVEGERRHPS